MKSAPPSDRLPFGQAYGNTGLSGRLALIVSTWFGAGLLPKAPGTFGTLAALPMAYLVCVAGGMAGGLIILLFMGISVWAGGRAERLLDRRDPPEVVVDEVAGFMVSLFLLPPTWFFLVGGFVIFRIMDIAKPFPIRRIERVPGGAGILLDDVAAGIYTNALLRGAGLLLGLF